MNTILELTDKQPLILVIDDITENLKGIGSILMTEKYRVIIASEGAEGIETAIKELPDLILLDIRMPWMDGFEVCKRLKKNQATAHIPVIFLTASNSSEDIVKSFEAGGNDYISKPFQAQEMLARVSVHVKLKLSLEKLKELNITKDKFFSIIAHDLRNQFTHLLGITKWLLDNALLFEQNDLQKILRDLNISVKNTYKLLENLLEWAGMQTGKFNLVPESISLVKLISDEIEEEKLLGESKKIMIYKSLSEGLIVYSDKFMLSCILRNLLTNAIKYTNKEGTINIFARSDKQQTEISVKDNGIGMNENIKNNLFRTDVNFSVPGTDDERGTGLGLIICKDFVEKLGGRLWVESEAGKGSEFKFTIPLKLSA